MTSEVLSTDGGPAFPHDNQELGTQHRIAQPGMTLRDYFAAQALVANKGWIAGTADDAARDAYTIADAMLKAREAT